MFFSTQIPLAYWRSFTNVVWAPMSPKNLRVSAMLVAIYQLLIAHLFLFLILLGLAHAEQMKTMLAMDIADQKENGFYSMTPFHNQLRLHIASELVSVIEVLLYISTAVAAIYLLTTIALFIGILKNRAEMILPWLIVEFIFMVSATIMITWLPNERIAEFLYGKLSYWVLVFTVLTMHAFRWYVVQSFYQSLRTMNKLREIATVAIPCPAPGAIPFHFRRENMYLGSNGYKHILTESPDGTY